MKIHAFLAASIATLVSARAAAFPSLAERQSPTPTIPAPALPTTAVPTPTGPNYRRENVLPENCNRWTKTVLGSTCGYFLSLFPGFTIEELVEWNPHLVNDWRPGCWISGAEYNLCTSVLGREWDPIPIPSPVEPYEPGNTDVNEGNWGTIIDKKPSPIQFGTPADCSSWYVVQWGDVCVSIANKVGISGDTFFEWNPSVGRDCADLWAYYAVCVGTIRQPYVGPPTTPAKTTIPEGPLPTTPVTAPNPVISGTHSQCNRYDYADLNASCNTFRTKYPTLTEKELAAWNPTIAEWKKDYPNSGSCYGIRPGFWFCTSIVGRVWPNTTEPEPTPVTPYDPGETHLQDHDYGTIVYQKPHRATQPLQPVDCNAWYVLLTFGDSCQRVLRKTGLTFDELYELNPEIQASCTGLWSGYGVCIGTVRKPYVYKEPPPTTTILAPTSTASVSGVPGVRRRYRGPLMVRAVPAMPSEIDYI